MEQKTIQRFRTRTIILHWLFALTFILLLVTGGIMFFGLMGLEGGVQIRTVHRIAAVFFVFLPAFYLFLEPDAARSFLKETFNWDHDSLAWLKMSLSYYFKGKGSMPPQGYLNGDQKLWQLIVTITSIIFASTGLLLWFFKLKISLLGFQSLRLTHDASFIIVLLMFPVHFYLTTLRPGFEESLSSMTNGKVSQSYAREHYSKWYQEKNQK